MALGLPSGAWVVEVYLTTYVLYIATISVRESGSKTVRLIETASRSNMLKCVHVFTGTCQAKKF